MSFAEKPSNYEFLKQLRLSKTASLKPCPLLRPETQLRNYQAIGTLHMVLLTRMALGDGVGLGKTAQDIAAYAILKSKDPELKALVVTPKSATKQWEEEFIKFTQGISVHVLSNVYARSRESGAYNTPQYFKERGIKFDKLEGFEARKAQYDTVTADVLVTNYFPVKDDYLFLTQNRSPKYMVTFDEMQEFKNDKTQVFFGASQIAEKAQRVYGLSATLIKNRLEEAYNIYKVLVPGIFPGKNKFLEEYTVRQKMSRWEKGKKRYFNKIVDYKNKDKFKEKIDPYFLIRRTREVADELPQLISRKIILELSPAQDQLYKQALSGDLYRRFVKDKYFKIQERLNGVAEPTEKDLKDLERLKVRYEESMTREGLQKSKLAALALCQLVSNGPQWLSSTEEGESSKETEFRRLFAEELTAEKVIVFSRFKSGLSRLEAILDDLGLKHTKITGDNTEEERQQSRLEFQDPNKDTNIIFITQAGSAAINLQAANVILFYDTPWSYGDLYQTIGRAQRIGSLYGHISLLHMVNTKTIDEHVLKILEPKKKLINDIMGDIAEGAIEFDRDDGSLFREEEESDVNALFNSVFG